MEDNLINGPGGKFKELEPGDKRFQEKLFDEDDLVVAYTHKSIDQEKVTFRVLISDRKVYVTSYLTEELVEQVPRGSLREMLSEQIKDYREQLESSQSTEDIKHTR